MSEVQFESCFEREGFGNALGQFRVFKISLATTLVSPESEQGGYDDNAEEEEEGAMKILGFFVCFCFLRVFFSSESFFGGGWGEESVKDSQIFFLVHE